MQNTIVPGGGGFWENDGMVKKGKGENCSQTHLSWSEAQRWAGKITEMDNTRVVANRESIFFYNKIVQTTQ